MKKFTVVISFILCAILAATLVACGGNSTPPDANVPDTNRPSYDGTTTLVVYFSQPDNVNDSTVVIDGETFGNTQYMAYVIQENTGANIFRIIPETPYPTDHDELVDHAKDEKAENARPAINGIIESFEQYDTVFVGYPNWWGDMPMIMYTFFDSYDFSGKTIIPFNTHGGSGFSETISTISRLEPNATVDSGLSISRNRIQDAEQDIIDWIVGLGFEKPEVPDMPPENPAEYGNVLVVYYSATSRTENVANYIAQATGGELFELVPVNPYTSADLNYGNANSRVSREHNDENLRDIALVASTVENWEEYDTVFIGYPIWWGIAAWPVKNFILNNDFTGKNVIPFATSASSGLGQSGILLAKLAGEGNWLGGQRFSSGVSQKTVESWLAGLGFLS